MDSQSPTLTPTTLPNPLNPLTGVQVLIFDIFGTVFDWRGPIMRELESLGKKVGVDDSPQDWLEFANEWRKGYMVNIRQIAQGIKEGSTNVDILHREILNTLLSTPRWSHFGIKLDEQTRYDLNLVWHRLDAWPDILPSLHILKSHFIIGTLSNGNMRLLIDLSKSPISPKSSQAYELSESSKLLESKPESLPWDFIFSADLFGGYKPNPTPYLSALSHLGLSPPNTSSPNPPPSLSNSPSPSNAAMIASHLWDLQAAAKVGMKTVYVKREGEDTYYSKKGNLVFKGVKGEGSKEGKGEGFEEKEKEGEEEEDDKEEEEEEEVKSKQDGGEVDLVVNDLRELAGLCL
ncbi:HAD-like domain-containing protein [Lentinula aciculospora]|uniref:HAD-like domain-containing protein n=1 Tax=Lentinula aciculospora TaxID=153920 RepID=A0A9W9A2P4_9AGAR|nr:HAD-like domain-containing protein [Lentinula aciculospora]